MDSRKIRFIFEPIFVSGKYYYLIQLYRWTTVKEGEKELIKMLLQNGFPPLKEKFLKQWTAPASLLASPLEKKNEIKQNYQRQNVSSIPLL